MPAILCVVGEHKAGKTRVIEALLPALQARGLRVAAVKHSTHSPDLDREGKDTWRYSQAGARAVAICAPGRFALIKQVEGEASLPAAAALLAGEVDLLLAEGFGALGLPRIEVAQAGASGATSSADLLVAVVGDAPVATSAPQFRCDEIEPLADRVTAWLATQAGPEVTLLVDGKPVPLNRFASEILARGVEGMVSALRGVPGAPSGIVVAVQPGRHGRET
jgi:molybdopterin-guanine dinucleotide biosynthesis protein B